MADSPVAGKWACTSNDGAGHEAAWTLVVKEDGGKLSGTFMGGPEVVVEMPLVDPEFAENMFTFKLNVNANCVIEAKLKLDADKMEGPFGCSEAKGTLKAARQP
jgi:hypothetical protein